MSQNNLQVLRAIRIKGQHVAVGSVISKSAFENKGDWDDLCKMTPAKLKEVDSKVTLDKRAAKAAMPGTE